MRVFLTGGTGLIGRALVRRLLDRGDEAVIVTRDADRARRDASPAGLTYVQGDPASPGPWQQEIDGANAVINLVGHNVFADRWNAEIKRKIRDSRVHSTARVVDAIGQAARRPKVLVQASAIGYYGPHGDENLTETSPPGNDFMAEICREWEAAAGPAEALGLRLALLRTGVVLARDEGALRAMTPVYRWVPGGAAPVGNGGRLFKPADGRQWLSWIHLDDIVGLFLLALDDPRASGPINGTSPHPSRHVDFGRALAHVLHRPFLPFGPPDALLQVLLGEVAQVVTKGQKALPARAESLCYAFRFPDLAGALAEIFGRQDQPAAAVAR